MTKDLKPSLAASRSYACSQHAAYAPHHAVLTRHWLRTNNLAVKFLFRPNSTDFLADPKVSGPYSMWLRILAAHIVEGSYCLSVIGHSSRTGSVALNDALSLARAQEIRSRLSALAPSIQPNLRALGLGFRETIIGTGTDDARDALDRRVEFRVIECPK